MKDEDARRPRRLDCEARGGRGSGRDGGAVGAQDEGGAEEVPRGEAGAMSGKKSNSQIRLDERYAFVRAVGRALEILGARNVEPVPPPPVAKGRLTDAEISIRVSGGRWILDLDVDGQALHVAPYGEWIACRFEKEPKDLIRAAALRANPSLNPYSYKWNWHFYSVGAGEKEARDFGLALCSLMPIERAAALVERLNAARLTEPA